MLWGIVTCLPAGALWAKSAAGPYDLSSSPKYASIIIDAKTGMVLSQENADRSLHPASLTKMMTMLMVFEALDRGKISNKTKLVASNRSSSAPPSRAGLKAGDTITVYEALRTMATKSANDVAVTVAENLGGSEARFVQMMNLKARELGMSNTNFVNASGLHDNQQVSTARDMSRLAKHLIDRYPQYYPIFGLRSYQYHGKNFQNHNHLMKTYAGMDGIKTGYVTASGFNLVASAKRKGVRLIGVVMGGPSTNIRNTQMAALLDQGFVKYSQLSSTGYYANGRYADMELKPLKNPLNAQKLGHTGTQGSGAPPLPMKKPANDHPAVEDFANSTPPTQTASLGAITPSQLTPTPLLTADKIANEQPAPAAPAISAAPSPSVPMPKSKPILKESSAQNETKQSSLKPSYLKLPEKYQSSAAKSGNGASMAQIPSLQAQTPPATPAAPANKWQIQIGAFADQPGARASLSSTLASLPGGLRNVNPLVIPLRTADAKWIYRGRLSGYTQQEALDACAHLKSILRDCLPIAPAR
ncbi:MAG: D-alanyl-D-alanine carboxypeptidase [Alphaproteobacteria bacterium]|nr:D-alanyl-D-alanine carboxypeptidase [Alphaproteobacteria bacterium]